MRRYVEDTLVVRDWFELTVAQNLVSDGLVYPLLFHKLDEQLAANGAGQVGMLTEFMRLWFAESQRWVDALLKTVINESAGQQGPGAGLGRSLEPALGRGAAATGRPGPG